MKRTLAALAATVVMGTALTACGGGDSSSSSGDYCDQLKDTKAAFTALDGGGADAASGLQDAADQVAKFADSAPESVRDDWQVLDDAFSKIEAALKDAGISFADLASIQAGKIPPGADVEKLAQLGETMSSIGGQATQDAGDAIAADAKKECNIDLESDS